MIWTLDAISFSIHSMRNIVSLIFFALTLFLCGAASLEAASWNNIEPFKSRRDDVKQALGTPLTKGDDAAATPDGTMRFKINGGTVTITFVTAKLIHARNLSPDVEGTVFQIALQHDNASDTPATLGLTNNGDYKLADRQGVSVYTNAKKGIIYTFVNGKLKTSWYNPSAQQLARAVVARAKKK